MENATSGRWLMNCSTATPWVSMTDWRLFAHIIDGLAGNCRTAFYLSAAVINRHLAASLTLLTLTDSCLLATAFGYYSLQALLRLLNVHYPTDQLIVYLHAFASATNTASIWLVVLVTVQRYVAVRRPFNVLNGSAWLTAHQLSVGNSLHSIKTFYLAPLLILALSVAFNAPTFFEVQLIACFDPILGHVSETVWPSALRVSALYRLIYRVGCRLLFQSIGPFLLVLILTIRTQILLVSMQRSRHGLVATKIVKMDTAVRCLSIVIAAKFLMLRCLPVVLDVWETFFIGHTSSQLLFFDSVVKVSNFLVIVHSATNCLVYFGGKRYHPNRCRGPSLATNRGISIDVSAKVQSAKKPTFCSFHGDIQF